MTGTFRSFGMLGLMAAGLSGSPLAGGNARALPAMTQDALTTVQYDRYGYRRPRLTIHRRDNGYDGRSGLYSCAPGQVQTYLNRRACGGAKFPRRFF